jgi:hypothetical protein
MSKKLNKNVPKLRFPEFEGDWEKKSLQEISVNGFSNGVFNDPQKVGSGYRLINVKDMYSGESIDVESLTKLMGNRIKALPTTHYLTPNMLTLETVIQKIQQLPPEQQKKSH